MEGTLQADEASMAGDSVIADELRPTEVDSLLRQLLERLAISWGLGAGAVHHLAQRMNTYAFDPGEIILPHRARPDFVGLIVQGQVAAFAGPHRTGRRVAVLLPGRVIGDDTLTGNHVSELTLQALTGCEVRILRRADLQALVDERRVAWRETWIRRGLIASTLVLALGLLGLVALSLPSLRQALALAPMAIGQWCFEQTEGATLKRPSGPPTRAAEGNNYSPFYDRCVETAWALAGDLAPADANPPLALGTHYYRQGNMAAAERSFEAAKVLAPDLGEIHNNLGLIYARQGQHAKAIAAFQQALELEPGTAAIEHNLGLSLQAMEAYEQALAHYQLSLAFGEPSPNTLVNMAIGYYQTGQLSEAAYSAEEALRRDETSAPAHTVLAAVALASQRPEAALPHLRRAITLDAGYGQAYYYLGLVHETLGQPAEAIAAFEKALVAADDKRTQNQIRIRLQQLYAAETQGGSP